MDHFPCIYSITNTVNEKKYIGQTSDYHKRKQYHLWALRNEHSHNRHLQNAFNYYGEDSFVFDVVEKCKVEDLNEREQYWIEQFDTYNTGYNLDKGGGGIRGYKFTPEQLENMSRAHTGFRFTEEQRKHLSETRARLCGKDNPSYGKKWCERISPEKQEELRKYYSQRFSGENNPNYGKKMSEEQKQKISQTKKEYFKTHDNPFKGKERPEISGDKCYRAHAVVCVNTGEEFSTMDAAAEKYNISQGEISQCVSGKQKTAGKDLNGNRIIWVDKNDYIPMTYDEVLKKLKEFETERREKNQRKVQCITTGEVFESMKDACKKYNLNASYLSAHCRRTRAKNGYGYDDKGNKLMWKYVDE